MTVARLKGPLAAWLLNLAAASGVHAAGDQEPSAAAGREWTFAVAAYLWTAGIDGDIGLFGQEPAKVDESFSDIVKDLKFGAMGIAELHNGTWGLFSEIIYAKTKSDGSATRDIANVPVKLSAAVETSSFTGTLMGEFRVYSAPKGTLDLMVGARVWSVDNDVDLALTAGGPPIAQFSGSEGSTWVDPIIGARGRFNIDDKWYLNGWGMVGGFGAASDATWDVMAGVGYQLSDRLSFNAGYRALGVDYSDDGFVYDIVQRGPFLGTVIKF
jgi:hypothetical protein